MVLVEERVELSAHGSDDQLEQYALGRLPAAETPQLEEHLLACHNCREKVDEFEAAGIAFRTVLTDDLVRAIVPQQTGLMEWLLAAVRRPAVSMALAFVVLVALVGFFSRSQPAFAPVATLQLTAVRGNMPATAPARQFELTLADGPKEGGPFRVEVVNAVGASMWQGLAESGPAGVRVEVKQRLGQGDYFVRIYNASGAVLREYGFRVRN
jgi:anti-sigma factor RsiW